MATRTISTKVAITGESEYRAKVTAINSTLRTLKSELALVESQNRGTANSMTALQSKSEVLTRAQEEQKQKVAELNAALQNAKKAQQAYSYQVEQSSSKLAGARSKLDDLKKSTADTSTQQQKLTAEMEKHKRALDLAQAGLTAANKGVNDWQRSVNVAQRDLNNLDAEVRRNREYMDEAAHSANGCATSINGFGKETRDAADGAGAMSAGVNALATVLAAAGVTAGLSKIAEALRACVEASLEFEQAMAGVRRTVGGTDAEIGALAKQFEGMALEIPTTTTELGKIAETAGQLGIARDKVEEFTRVMAMLSTTTDLTAENAATMLAQFANITGLTDYERLGATVAQLGDATATTASKVVEMSQGMAAAANIAGMSETDILAIAAAVGSLGIEAQAGSTAMSTLISNIFKAVETGSEQLSQFASVAGMSAEAFASAWRKDAAGALDAFIRGLDDVERNGRSAVVILDELGITNVRQTKAILGLANAGDLLTGTITQANQAWKDNTALQGKAGIMYATTQSRVTMARNALDQLMVAIGDALSPALREMAVTGGDAFTWAAEFVKENPGLVHAMTGVTVAAGALTAGLVGMGAVVAVINAVKVALVGLNVAAGPIVAVIAAVSALAGLLTTLYVSSADSAAQATAALNESLKDAQKAVSDAAAEVEKDTTAKLANLEAVERLLPQIEALNEKNNRTAAEQAKLNSLVETANNLYPGLIGNVDTLTGSYDINTASIEKNIEALKRKAQADAYTALAEEKYQGAAKLRMDLDQKAAEYEELRAQAEEARGNAEIARFSGNSSAARYWETEARMCEAQMGDLEEAARQTRDQMVQFEAEADSAMDSAADLADSSGDAADEIDGMGDKLSLAAEKAKELSEATKTLASETEGLTSAFAEQAENGGLSLDTTLKLIDAGYGAALMVDEETGSVRLNAEAYATLAQKKIDEQIAGLKDAQRENKTELLRLEGQAALEAALGNEALAISYQRQADALKGSMAGSEAMLAQLQALKDGLGDVISGNWNGKAPSSPKSSPKSAKKEKTQAELDLEAYRAAAKELDHQRAMEEISEKDYYQRKGNLAALYLKDNLEERRKWDEELHAYQKGAYERELSALDQSLKNGLITYEQHAEGMKALQGQYLDDGSDAWYENQRRRQKDQEDAYSREKADLDYFLKVGVISKSSYYAQLAQLRDQYLEENSAKWRSATEELYQWEQEQQEAQRKALEERREAAAKAQEAEEKERAELVKRYTQERIDAIKAEQKAEEERVNALIDGVNDEIAARKRLRQQESDEDAVSKAKKTLEAARTQLDHARDENTRAELQKEVTRAQEAYDKAVQDKADNDWEYGKRQEIEALKDQLEAAKKDYQNQIDEAPQWAEGQVRREEEARAAADAARAQKEADELGRMLEEMKSVQRTASGAVAAAAQAAAQVTNISKDIYSTVNHNSVSVTTAAAPMTSGQMFRVVEKALDKLSR